MSTSARALGAMLLCWVTHVTAGPAGAQYGVRVSQTAVISGYAGHGRTVAGFSYGVSSQYSAAYPRYGGWWTGPYGPGGPYGPYGLPLVSPYPSPVVVVAPAPVQPLIVQIPEPVERRAPANVPQPRKKPVEAVGAALPGRPAGRFRAIDPADREPPEAPRPRAPFDEAEPLRPEAESRQLLALGRAAFAAEQYGRAAERFEAARRLRPGDAETTFVLAQARFALGKYREAVAALDDGLRQHPDWPRSGFRVRPLYADPAEFARQLTALEDAMRRYPDDPILLFLWGYQMWFDDQAARARVAFRRAFERSPDLAVVQRFLEQ